MQLIAARRLDELAQPLVRCGDGSRGPGPPRPYDLRHSFASLLIREQRVSIVDLADQLGRAPTMKLDTYSHVMGEHRGAPPVLSAR